LTHECEKCVRKRKSNQNESAQMNIDPISVKPNVGVELGSSEK
jgi:hypothetical protein